MTETRLIRTVCDPNCHANPRCGIAAYVENGRIVRIEPGSFPLPEYDRRVCAMGMARLEQQYHKARLQHPLRRVGGRGEGQWQRVSWDEAFDWLADRLRRIAEQYGSRSLAFFSGSGAAGVLTRGSSHRFAAAIGGTAHRAGGVDYGVRLSQKIFCFSSAADTCPRTSMIIVELLRVRGHEIEKIRAGRSSTGQSLRAKSLDRASLTAALSALLTFFHNSAQRRVHPAPLIYDKVFGMLRW